MACVRKRRGKWVIDFRDQTGVRRWETFRTRREADDALHERRKEIERDTYTPQREQMTFDQLVDEFRAAHIASQLREATRRDYESCLSCHLLPHFKGWRVRAITVAAVERYRDSMLKARHGRRTINKALTLLGSVCRHAVKHGWMATNPASMVAKLRDDTEHDEQPIEDNVLRPVEIQRMLASADERWRVLLMTAVLTGLRAGELLGLRWSDVDWNARQLIVRRSLSRSGGFQQPKTKAGRRRVDLSELLISELKRWKLKCPKAERDDDAEPLDLMFPNTAGKPENHSNVVRRGFKPALRCAGLREIRFHDLRHTFASLLIDNQEHPKYIQSQMGHSSIKVTMDVYGHLMSATNARAAEKLAKLALGEKPSDTVSSKTVADEEIAELEDTQLIELIGGPCWNRTSDHLIKSQMLYRLS
jgi:integrase